MTREEYIALINEEIGEDNEKAVRILEGFDDYTKMYTDNTTELEKLRQEKEDILKRYRDRFSDGDKNDTVDVQPDNEEIVIDTIEI